jgi:HlyD family secretion protein
MDVVRSGKAKRRRRTRLTIYAALGLAALAGITYGLTRLKPAAPSVEGATSSRHSQRGQMLRQVRGPGTLVPKTSASSRPRPRGASSASTAAGTEVTAGTVLLELSNPELQQSSVDIEYQLRAAEAESNNIRARLDSERLSQQAVAADVRSEYQQASCSRTRTNRLAKEGLSPALTLELSRVRARSCRIATPSSRSVWRARCSTAQAAARLAGPRASRSFGRSSNCARNQPPRCACSPARTACCSRCRLRSASR